MRARLTLGVMSALPLFVFAWSCALSDRPPPLGDSDASIPREYPEAGQREVLAPPLDAGAPLTDGGTASARDYEGICDQGKLAVWHFFDFQTHTPQGSSIDFRARSAFTRADLDTAPSVLLANVTGPDITIWTGVDVDSKLTSIGQKSQHWLRVTTTLLSSADAGAPAVNATRQMYDCVLAQ